MHTATFISEKDIAEAKDHNAHAVS
jgi:hypothetical protein